MTDAGAVRVTARRDGDRDSDRKDGDRDSEADRRGSDRDGASDVDRSVVTDREADRSRR